jgi:hypothetical protein
LGFSEPRSHGLFGRHIPDRQQRQQACASGLMFPFSSLAITESARREIVHRQPIVLVAQVLVVFMRRPT